jgi:hypothetical protein
MGKAAEKLLSMEAFPAIRECRSSVLRLFLIKVLAVERGATLLSTFKRTCTGYLGYPFEK